MMVSVTGSNSVDRQDNLSNRNAFPYWVTMLALTYIKCWFIIYFISGFSYILPLSSSITKKTHMVLISIIYAKFRFLKGVAPLSVFYLRNNL